MTIELILTLPMDAAPTGIEEHGIVTDVANILGLDPDEIELDWQEVEG